MERWKDRQTLKTDRVSDRRLRLGNDMGEGGQKREGEGERELVSGIEVPNRILRQASVCVPVSTVATAHTAKTHGRHFHGA